MAWSSVLDFRGPGRVKTSVFRKWRARLSPGALGVLAENGEGRRSQQRSLSSLPGRRAIVCVRHRPWNNLRHYSTERQGLLTSSRLRLALLMDACPFFVLMYPSCVTVREAREETIERKSFAICVTLSKSVLLTRRKRQITGWNA